VSGLWMEGWELAIAALAFALVWAAPPPAARRS
jgi:hypothetical protein